MTGLVDTHCHLAHVERDPEDVLDEARVAGVEVVVDIGMGLAESEVAAERAEHSGGRVFASVGIHPNDLDDFRSDPDQAMVRLRELTALGSVVAVGETGLDFYRDRSTPREQEDAFRAHIALAKVVGKALVIHCRDAHDRILEVLDEEDAPGRVVMHCFSGNAAHARACASRGFYCSFAGNLTYKKNDELREAASVVPEELLLVETDAPFLAPHPHRGKPNSPSLVALTAAALAAVRGTDLHVLTDRLFENSKAAFGLPVLRSR